jgi:hypothetical protein
MTKEEYAYAEELVSLFGKEVFDDLFLVGDKGRIMAITPPLDEPTPMAVLFFGFNVMINQRLRSIDKLVHRVSILEKRVAKRLK